MAAVTIVTQDVADPEGLVASDRALELGALYAACRPWLLRRVRLRWRVRGDAAEDLVHDTWVRVIEHIDRFDRGRQFEPWAQRILDNVVVDHLRHAGGGVVPAARHDDEIAVTRNDVDRVADRDVLVRAIAALPPRQQRTVVSVLIEGLSLSEAAEHLGVSYMACGQLLHRGRVGLRRALLDQGMLPGLAPLWWLRERWMGLSRRLGDAQVSAVAGATTTVVALAITASVTLGAGDATAGVKRDLRQGHPSRIDTLDTSAARVERSQRAENDQSTGPAGSGAVDPRSHFLRSPGRSKGDPPRPWVPLPSAEVPVTGTRVHQEPIEDPDYYYGVAVEVDKPRRDRQSAGVTSENERGDQAEEMDHLADESACRVAEATPATFCVRGGEDR
jgi:RNA polymerase sigma-70 factor, ECF subfamily